MKTVISSILACVLLPVPLCLAQAPANAPAGATGLCKDGTYYTGPTKDGACRGHKGVKEWYGAPTAKTTAAAKATAAAKTPAATEPKTSNTPVAQPPAGATGLCKDGTYYTGPTKDGACRGHKGVKEWYGAPPATAAKTTAPPAAKTPAASTPAPAAAPAPKAPSRMVTQAAGGGADKVWLNTASNVYHCPGSKYYGKTKAGAYMSEAEAKSKGAHADHNQACK